MKIFLGAHITGRAGKQLKSEGKIANIVGLDPASVGFDFFEKDKRLTDSDADYVQIIHTDGDKFGFANPLGHGTDLETFNILCTRSKIVLSFIAADFYPNKGAQQPGCPLRNRLTNLIGIFILFNSRNSHN